MIYILTMVISVQYNGFAENIKTKNHAKIKQYTMFCQFVPKWLTSSNKVSHSIARLFIGLIPHWLP